MGRVIVRPSLFIKDFRIMSRGTKIRKAKRLAELIIFALIFITLFMRLTYLFRNNSWEPQHINGIKNETNLDVVCVGGSSTFVYWEPFLAWHEFGMTSYDFATDSARPAIMRGYVKEAVDRAHPDLVVIDMRCYTGDAISRESLTDAEGGIRNMTDSVDLGYNRLLTVSDVMNYYNAFEDEAVDPWSYFIDIAKYHTNDAKLGAEESWKHLNNHYESAYKGFEFITSGIHDFVTPPKDYKTSEIGALNPSTEDSLNDLIRYLEKNDVEALFVAGPIPVSKDAQKQYNKIGEIVEGHGYRFLNTNDYYSEMDIDFSKDFYNAGHVNVFGAEKYTRFVGDYIKGHYDIEDHRDEKSFSEWDEQYVAAHEQDVQLKKTISDAINSKNEANRKGKEMQYIDVPDEWIKQTINDNYTIVFCSKNHRYNKLTPWNTIGDQENRIRVYTGTKSVVEYDDMQETDYTGSIGSHSSALVVNAGEKAKIQIGDDQIPIKSDGTYIAVFDNNYNEILDCVCISGKETFQHIDIE